MRFLLACLLTLGLGLAVVGQPTASHGDPWDTPFEDTTFAASHSDGTPADPCSCVVTGGCSASSLHAAGSPASVPGKPPHILPVRARVPSGLPPDVPSPPPRPV